MAGQIKIKIKDLSFSYNGKMVLRKSSMNFANNQITALVGPSGAGKSTFLMTLNRLWETVPGSLLTGKVTMHFGDRFYDIHKDYPVTQLRRQVGTIFQVPNPLPMSIQKNVAFPLELKGKYDKNEAPVRVEECLRKVGLWSEVHDRLHASALDLSGGQQQRLCIARALILQPEVLLLDEPTSSLDHNAASAIETLLNDLKRECTILMVSHYLDQVQRVADSIVELQDGVLIRNN